MLKLNFTIALICAAIAFPSCGCKSDQKPAASQGGSSAPALTGNGQTFSDSESGVSLTYPGGWTKHDSKEDNLLIVPSKNEASTRIVFEIPKLPPHIPGLLPLGGVRDGYVDDLKKKFGTVESKDLAAPTVGDAKARLVRSTWSKDGQSMQETGLLLVRGDHVYLLLARSSIEQESSTRSAFDAIQKSIKWSK